MHENPDWDRPIIKILGFDYSWDTSESTYFEVQLKHLKIKIGALRNTG